MLFQTVDAEVSEEQPCSPPWPCSVQLCHCNTIIGKGLPYSAIISLPALLCAWHDFVPLHPALPADPDADVQHQGHAQLQAGAGPPGGASMVLRATGECSSAGCRHRHVMHKLTSCHGLQACCGMALCLGTAQPQAVCNRLLHICKQAADTTALLAFCCDAMSTLSTGVWQHLCSPQP